jgi:hypothetical protein
MKEFFEKNAIALITLVFSAGMFVMMIKMFFNDFQHLKKDYFEFKEKLIKDIAVIMTKLDITDKGD